MNKRSILLHKAFRHGLVKGADEVIPANAKSKKIVSPKKEVVSDKVPSVWDTKGTADYYERRFKSLLGEYQPLINQFKQMGPMIDQFKQMGPMMKNLPALMKQFNQMGPMINKFGPMMKKMGPMMMMSIASPFLANLITPMLSKMVGGGGRSPMMQGRQQMQQLQQGFSPYQYQRY